MEWLKGKSLKQSFFIISSVFLCAGLILSIVSFMLCVNLRTGIETYPKYEITLDENGNAASSDNTNTDMELENNNAHNTQIMFLNILQFVLPVFFVILSLVLADIVFYRLKLKKPLSVLQSGAERIRQQDLDFEIKKCADDELGMLCSAFEKMRIELLNNNRELWRQIEERKRLNAAFSHDLRNPVTVLKGSATLLKKNLKNGNFDNGNVEETISLISQYTNRIEGYIEAMTMAQKLEDWKCSPTSINWSVLTKELEHSLSFLCEDIGKKIMFSSYGANGELFVDRAIIQNVAENLVNNALRYAKSIVNVKISHKNEKMMISILDNGSGFQPAILRKGVAPFL
ncbi:MAG: HAMP domain-containing histidine kinase, partial [Firmicutes bacterium]|nr:HAMP domain-containing histidine kinase [Bacillota bacterium]